MKLLIVPCICMVFSGILAIPVNDIDLMLEAGNETTVLPVTLEPVSTGPTTSVKPITIEPLSMSTEVTATQETPTIKPITFEPITGVSNSTEGPSAASIKPISSNAPPSGSTKSTQSTQSTPSTTPNNTPPTPEKKTGFDGGSFGGGIATGVGIFIILFVAWKCYVIKRQGKGYSTM